MILIMLLRRTIKREEKIGRRFLVRKNVMERKKKGGGAICL